MHRNVARAYNALWAEHKRVRVVWMKILAQGDRTLERKLSRAEFEDPNIMMKFYGTRSDFRVHNGGGFSG
jgi:hypothetical protein